MEQRFVRVWRDIESRVRGGEPIHKILRASPTRALVAALAAAPTSNPLIANLIATELLNRERRAPFLGALLVSLTAAVLIFALDLVYTGTPLFLESGARTYILAGVLTVAGLVSIVFYFMWRGALPGLRSALLPDDGY